MSNADRAQVSYIKEVTFGVTPATPTMIEVGYVTESLKNNTNATTSAQVRADRQNVGKVRTSRTAGGDVAVELQPNMFDDWLRSLLQSADWGAPTFTPIALTDAVVTVSSGGTIGTITTTIGDLSTIKKGMVLKLTGGPTGFIDDMVIATKDAVTTSVDVSGLRSGFTTDTLTIDLPDEIQNGVLQESYTLMKDFQDLDEGTVTDKEFHLVKGQTVGAFSLSISPENIVTATFTFNGLELTRSTAGPSGFSVTALTERDPFDAVESITVIVVETDSDNPTPQDLIEIETTEVTMEMGNNLRDRLVVGRLGPTSIGSGKVDVAGTTAMFFDNEGGKDARPIIDANEDFTPGRMMFKITDPADGKGYVFDFKRLRFEDVETFGGGVNTDSITTANFSCERDTDGTFDYTVRIARFSAS